MTSKIERKISNIPVIKKHHSTSLEKKHLDTTFTFILSSSPWCLHFDTFDTSHLSIIVLLDSIFFARKPKTWFLQLFQNSSLHLVSWKQTKKVSNNSFFQDFHSSFLLISFNINNISVVFSANRQHKYYIHILYSIPLNFTKNEHWNWQKSQQREKSLTFLPVISCVSFPYSHFSSGFNFFYLLNIFFIISRDTIRSSHWEKIKISVKMENNGKILKC